MWVTKSMGIFIYIQQTVIDLMHWRHKGSHLHNNDASLVSRSAHVLCWQCALALGLSVRGPGRASPAVWLAGFAPLAACLAMTHVAVFRLTPNAAGHPSVTSYAYGLYQNDTSVKKNTIKKHLQNHLHSTVLWFFLYQNDRSDHSDANVSLSEMTQVLSQISWTLQSPH